MADAQVPSPLADLLEREHDAVLARFADAVYATSLPESVDRQRALDSASELLAELRAALRAPGSAYESMVEHSASGTEHGAQRFGMGMDLPTMVREYRALQRIILDMIEEGPLQRIGMRDARVLSWFMMGASARAAESYARERDTEMQRQAEQHLGFLAHELRNPLGSVALGLAISKETGELKQSPTSRAVERGVRQMQALIDSALVEMRLRDNNATIDRELVDVRGLLQEIAEDTRPELEAKRQTIEVHATDVVMSADPRLLRSAVSNLVRNAVKFSVSDSTISVRVRSVDGRVVIEVEDACGGLPEGATQKMFAPYVQTGRNRSGFGLGLAIASQAARAHHGTIRVVDIPGRGCVFSLDLPERDPEAGIASAR